MKKKEGKKPDQVVFSEEQAAYDAALRPYATNLGAPAIQVKDITTWKNTKVHAANHHFKSKFERIKEEYDEMMETFEYNKLIYSAKFNFEPIVGEAYHLYRSSDGAPFISLIAPSECTWDFVGTFRLSTDMLWNRVE